MHLNSHSLSSTSGRRRVLLVLLLLVACSLCIVTGMLGSLGTDDATLETQSLRARAIDLLNSNIESRSYAVSTLPDYMLEDEHYFHMITKARKESPGYPYIAQGDFDGDGLREDMAVHAVPMESGNPTSVFETRICVFLRGRLFVLADAGEAISVFPKQTLRSHWEERTVDMQSDGILVEYFEKSAFVYYWTPNGFERFQLSD